MVAPCKRCASCKRRLPRTWVALIAATVALVLNACATSSTPTDEVAPQAAPPASDPVGLSFEPGPDQIFRLVELETALNRSTRGDSKMWRDEPEVAPLIVHLAATSPSPTVQAAALFAMADVFSPRAKSRPRPTADYLRTVQYRLSATDPQVLAGALQAARTALGAQTASAELAAAVVSLGRKRPSDALRFEIIHALGALSADNRSVNVVQLFRESLDASFPAHVLAMALHALLRAMRTFESDEALTATLVSLSAHVNPAVRGRAIELLGAVTPQSPQLLTQLKLALADAHPYVRGEACEAAARARQLSLIHPLVSLLEDEARAEFTLDGWSRLSGAPGLLRLRAGDRSEVGEVALEALRSLSAGELRLRRLEDDGPEEARHENIKRALAWYRERKRSLPL